MASNLITAELPSSVMAGNVRYDVTPVLSGEQIQERVDQMGQELAEHYAERGSVHVLTVMNGALHFASDLRRSMQRASSELAMTSDQIRLSSYNSLRSSGMVRLRGDAPQDLEGRHVLIVEDVLDSGLSLDWLLRYMAPLNPASLEIAVAVNKDNPHRRSAILGQTAIHSGFPIANDFVVGYGLDVAERYRDLEGIYKLTPAIPDQG